MKKKRRQRHAIKKLPPGRAEGAEGYPSARGKSTRVVYSPEIDGHDDGDLHGCVRLWRAVLAQAVQDAKSKRTKQEYGYIRHTAVSWLLDNTADFNMVCDLAGLDASSTRRRILQAQGIESPRIHSRPTKAERSILADLLGLEDIPKPARRKKAKRLSSYAARHVQLELMF